MPYFEVFTDPEFQDDFPIFRKSGFFQKIGTANKYGPHQYFFTRLKISPQSSHFSLTVSNEHPVYHIGIQNSLSRTENILLKYVTNTVLMIDNLL